MADKTKRGRKQDARQTNRRQKHELDTRAEKWGMTPKVAVILADMYADKTGLTFSEVMVLACAELRRANREAGRARVRK